MAMRLELMRRKNGEMISYATYGQLDASRTVFYFHGFPGSRVEGAIVDAEATRSQIRIIAFDRPGYGESSPVPKRSLRMSADIVGELADSLMVNKFGLIGVSGGGPHALACAALLADRVSDTAIIAGMGPTVLGRNTHTLSMLLSEMHPVNRTLIKLGIFFPWMGRAVVSLVSYAWRCSPRFAFLWLGAMVPKAERVLLQKPGIKRIMLQNLKQALRQGDAGTRRDYEILTTEWDVDPASIKENVTFWHGTIDDYVPIAFSRYLQTKLCNSTLEIVPQKGHFMALEILASVFSKLKV